MWDRATSCAGSRETDLTDFRFRPGQRKVLATLARVVCPPELEPLGLADAVLEETELMVRALPAYLRLGLLAGLAMFDQGFRFYPGSGGRRFAAAGNLEVADGYFTAWHHSPLTVQFQFAKAIKGLLCFSYYEQPSVLAAIDVHADRWIAQVTRQRLEKYAQDVRLADEEVLL